MRQPYGKMAERRAKPYQKPYVRGPYKTPEQKQAEVLRKLSAEWIAALARSR